MKYLVIEIQKFEDGAITTPTYAYDDRNAAEGKFHDICGAAARSTLPVHACAMLTEDGRLARNPECYKHEKEAPETAEEA